MYVIIIEASTLVIITNGRSRMSFTYYTLEKQNRFRERFRKKKKREQFGILCQDYSTRRIRYSTTV